jgi:outer membrane protein assembly factor BamB
VLSDQGPHVYLLAVESQPTPRLTVEREIEAPAAIASAWAVLGDTAFAVDANGRLLSFRLPTLEAGEPLALPGALAWGPNVVGEKLLVATADTLLCFDNQAKLLWNAPLDGASLTGAPSPAAAGPEAQFVCALTAGRVWAVAAETGNTAWTVELGVPLSGSPQPWNERIVVAGSDGSLYVVGK